MLTLSFGMFASFKCRRQQIFRCFEAFSVVWKQMAYFNLRPGTQLHVSLRLGALSREKIN